VTPDEVTALLAYASALDPRIRRNDPYERQMQVKAWHRLLDDVAADDAIRLTDRHYMYPGAEPLMPGNLRRRIGEDPDRLPCAAPLRQYLAGASVKGLEHIELEERERNGRGRRAYEEAMAEFNAKRSLPDARSTERRITSRWGRERRETDEDRRKSGKAVTVCHTCAVEIPVPDGWNPARPDSPRLYCARHAAAAVAAAASGGGTPTGRTP